MKTLLLLITLFAFLQSAFLPVNLVMVILVARALVVPDRENLFLAFFGGIILSFLTQVNLGYFPLIFILVVKLGEFIKTFPVSFNIFMIFLSGSVLIAIVGGLNMLFISQNMSLYTHLVEAILVVPFYFVIKLWEERFVVKSHMKLRMR
jgi:hypothetical protein